ncbi:unnamed protein product [Caenorhabditis angaria]|uniref:Peptidase M13 C-terminal domain-containing protein n=1 Tax=Caenorhabditis angaria TaxID=860376 RepID=A0A9P1I9C0_9PELO|nr:unnamed protein product [Caenorhabditis angaria]
MIFMSNSYYGNETAGIIAYSNWKGKKLKEPPENLCIFMKNIGFQEICWGITGCFTQKSKEKEEAGECQKLGQTLSSTMNLSVNPCDDFYEFVCGAANYPTGNYWSEVFGKDLRELVEVMQNYKPETSNQKVAVEVFKKCVDDKNGDLDKFMADFWNDEKNDLTTLLIEATKLNLAHNGLFKFLLYPVEVNGIRRTQIFIYLKEFNGDVITFEEAERLIKFMNLTEFAYQLLPQEYRRHGALNEVISVHRSVLGLEEKIRIRGIGEIRKDLHEAWKNELNAHFEPSHKSAKCLLKALKVFPATFGMILINKSHFIHKNIEKADEVFEKIRTIAGEIISENEWIEEPIKEMMFEKLEKVKKFIGIPEVHQNQTALDFMYNRVSAKKSLEDQSYLELLRNVMHMNIEESFLRWLHFEPITYTNSPFRQNANYNILSHGITVSTFFLKYPFIDVNLPEWSEIASHAFVVAHEVSHMFGPVFNYIDAHFNSVNFTHAFETTYNTSRDCLIEQYGTFKYPGFDVYLNGSNTVRENFADILASKIIYRLFEEYKATEKNPQLLPSLSDYNLEQQFFMRAAQTWCENELNEEAIRIYEKDTHSAGMFRVRGMTMNSQRFAEAFGCPVGSPMNPQDKCEIF